MSLIQPFVDNPIVPVTRPGLIDSVVPFSFGNALEFDGVNDEINLDSSIDISDDFTFSGWFKIIDFANTPILVSSGSRADMYFQLETTTAIRVRYNTIRDYTVPLMSVDTWHHKLITRDSGTTHVYLNGVESTSGGQDSGSLTIDFQVFGNYQIATLFELEGFLDEFYFWVGVVGTEANAASIYNSGDGVEASTIIATPDHVYRYNQSSGTNLPDTGNAATNNGTLTNFADPDSNWVAH